MGLDENTELPHIYLYHSLTHKTTPFPEPLDNAKLLSPELIVAWAKTAKLELDIEGIQAFIDSGGNEGQDLQKAREELNQYKTNLLQAERELEDVRG